VAQTMKVRKGDVVHVLRGKDAGKEGRVVEALPKQGRVVVENINVVKRHRRPRPIQNTSGLGGAAMTPAGSSTCPRRCPSRT
jgi:large subunit ribosomal protein L24